MPRFVERIWGSEELAPYFPACGKRIGEVWLTANDCLVGGTATTLSELAAEQPAILGCSDGNGFPLLLKLLFPKEKLSIQVHPDDTQARVTLGEPRGKTECWYVLSAEPGAEVAVGLREPLEEAAIREAIGNGTLESKLRMLPVKAGDMIFIDAGTVHAIGPGVVLLETQQYSDVTYRLWDYGRGRELHVEEGLAVTRSATAAGLVMRVAMGGFDRLLHCPYFAVDRFELRALSSVELGCAGQLQILVALNGGAALCGAGRPEFDLPQGHAVLLPAHQPAYTLRADRACAVMRVSGAYDSAAEQ